MTSIACARAPAPTTGMTAALTAALTAAFLLPLLQTHALAQGGYPNRAVRIVAPTSPPGGSDTAARIIAPALSERLGQPVVVENRAGAGTMLGHDYVAKSPPDGYTLVMAINTLAIIPVTIKNVPYDALRDFAPISEVLSQPAMMIAHPSLPARTVKELVALAKARPGEVLYASGGNGSNPHMGMELFLYMTGTRMLHVPFRGGGAMAIGVMTGQGSVGVLSILASIPHVRSGRVRAIGVTGPKRSEIAPDVPAIAETVKGYEALQWYGLMAPAGTPRDIITRLHKEVLALLRNPETRTRLTQDGADVVGNSPEEFAVVLRNETAKWAKVARAAGIKPE
jgi:tripartite-type tricarboxylate transporter receptor subunit TctC